MSDDLAHDVIEVLRDALDRQPIATAMYRATDDGDFVYEYVNPYFQALKPFLAMRGRTYAEVWPAAAEQVLPGLRRVAETGEAWAEQGRLLPVESESGAIEERSFDFAVSRLTPGPSALLLVSATDTTCQMTVQRREREMRESLELLAFSTELLLSSPDPIDAVQTLGERVMTHLGADVFFNYILEPGSSRLTLNAWGGVDERVARMIERLELGQAICGCVARDGERIISADVQNNGDERADLVRRMGVRCYVCHPLKVAGATVGTLSFGTKRTDRFSDDEIELMRTIANQVSVAMQRVRADQEMWFQSFVLENVSDSVIAYYPDDPWKGRIVYVNEAAWRSRGYTREEMLELNVLDLIAPEWRHALKPRLEALERGEVVRAESAHLRKDGAVFPVEVVLHRVEFHGRPIVVNVSHDITEAKAAEEKVRDALAAKQAELARTRVLEAVAEAAAGSRSLRDVSANSLDALVRHLELRTGTISAVDQSRGELQILAAVGLEPELLEAVRCAKLDAESPMMIVRAAARNEILRDADVPRTDGRRALLRRAGYVEDREWRHIAVPIGYDDRVLGVVFFAFEGTEDFTAEEIELLRSVSRVLTQAFENARLFDEVATRAHYAQALNRINEAVHSSLEFEQIMNRVVVEIAEGLEVDTAAIHMRVKDHWEFQHTHNLPEGLANMRLEDADARLSMHVLASREPVVSHDLLNDGRANIALMERFGLSALIGVPLVVRGQVIGVLFVGCLGRKMQFSPEQVDFVVKAAATLALALENARLYETERDIADRLQEALLAVPDHVRGVHFAHAYHSATEAARVGGDFYDVFELDDDRVGVVVGDVAGKGLDAAVLTSMVKNTVRAHANEPGKTPKQILELTNQVVYRSTATESFVTMFFGIIDIGDGRFHYANAGHTTAALVRSDGATEKLPVTGPLLGAFCDLTFDQAESSLAAGELLFLYTDGLTEARHDGELYGEERLFAALGNAQGRQAVEVVEDVVGDVMAFSHNRLRDDLAILAVARDVGREDGATREG